jgi:TolB-like protein/class 3 adenylate cyclase/predicted Zn-dependent protease
MTQESFKRKLTAILSADVEGYSRLMADDEEVTVRTLTTYRDVMTTLIQQHNGKVLDSPGDNLLAEFASVVDAVQCAVAVQKEIKARNAELPENRRMHFRIGINLGDVIQEEDRIYGDGVNIAARLEGLAEPGGICISRTAFDHIESKLPYGYEFLGDQTVKNIPKPVGAYRVLLEPRVTVAAKSAKPAVLRRMPLLLGAAALVLLALAGGIWYFFVRPTRPPIEAASVAKMAFPLPEKPSIAVLPFDNLSADPEQDYIADGITGNIIAGLSQIPDMFVIARNSVFTYKGKPVKIQQVSEDLGVRYVLEGSVQRSGDRLRLTAQLIDAIKGHHLWTQRYDRKLKDLFDLQDDVTLNILDAMQVKLTVGESPILHGTDNFEAWGHFVKGFSLLNRGTKEDILKARKHLEQALELDSAYAQAWSNLAATHSLEVLIGVSRSPADSIQQALKLVQKASALGGEQAYLHDEMNRIYMLQGLYDKAIVEGERAVALEPNSARSHIFLAMVLHYAKRPEAAIVHAEKAMRLEPFYRVWFLPHLAGPYEMVGRYEEALEIWKLFLERSLRGEFPPIYAHERLAINYARLDRMDKARAHAAEILKIKPDYTVQFYRQTTPYKDQKYLDSLVALLIKAGLSEYPPLQLPDKPSIAVLPFDNLSGDPQQEYFNDGLSEEIITALSKTTKLFVIARNSSFTYKGKPVNVQQVGRELGVQYVLEGSVRKAGDRVRITAQLVDANTGNHLWAERYDRELEDLFALQDEITRQILTALEVKLTEGEQALVVGSGTDNLEAYLKVLQARDLKRNMNIETNHKARRFAQEAIALDSNYATAYRWLSGTHLMDVWLGSSKSPGESLKKAIELAKKAISLDNSLAGAHGLLGNIYIMRKQYEKGIREAELAVELEPNGADAHALLGMGLRFADRPQEAIPMLKKAIRLNPHAPGWYLHNLAGAYGNIEKFGEAIEWGEKAVEQNPRNVLSRVVLCRLYSQAGRMDRARVQAKEILKMDPKFYVERFARTLPQKNQALKNRYMDALRKAGLK